VVAHLKEFVKTWILRREDQNAAIARYNDRLRAYAAGQKLAVLDLESVLSATGDERGLNPAYDAGDGLHLDEKAYPELDRELGRLIDRLERPASR
jgi:lysophospholipase L1-like esterase